MLDYCGKILICLLLINVLLICDTILDKINKNYLINNCTIISNNKYKIEYNQHLGGSFKITPYTITFLCPNGTIYTK